MRRAPLFVLTVAAAATAVGVACLGADPSLYPPGYDAGAALDAARPSDASASDAGPTCGVCSASEPCYAGTCGGGIVRQVSDGNGFACAVIRAGEVWCWGSAANGRLGPDVVTSSAHPEPVRIEGLTGIDKVSTGDAFACAHRQSDGAIFCWGKNDTLQLGHDPTMYGDSLGPFNSKPIQVPGIPGMIDVEVGSAFACAWHETETYCWGSDDQGQLAMAESATPFAPTAVPALAGITAMALSIDASSPNGCAIKADKTAWCWGANAQQQRGDDGGAGGDPVKIPGAANVDSVGSGLGVNCAIFGGELTCSGTNRAGEFAEKEPTSSDTFIATDAGALHALSLRRQSGCAIDGVSGDGPIRCWGANTRGQVGNGLYARLYDAGACNCGQAATLVQGLPAGAKFRQVSAGTTNAIALQDDGTVWAWGGASNAECGQPADDAGVVAACAPTIACEPVAERLLGFPITAK